MSATQRLEIEALGDVTVVHFRDPRISDPLEIDDVGRQISHLIESDHCTKLVIDFSPVEFLSSAMIGKLISLHRKVKVRKAALRLCNLQRQIQEIFNLCSLERIFDVCADLAAAIASFGQPRTSAFPG